MDYILKEVKAKVREVHERYRNVRISESVFDDEIWVDEDTQHTVWVNTVTPLPDLTRPIYLI